MAVETPIKEASVTQVKPEAPATPVNKTEELIKKVSQPEATQQTQQESELAQQFRKDIEGVKDPEVKKVLEEKLKNLEKGYNQKYMSLAEERKQVEALKQSANQGWTPERLKQELQKPDFVQAAQAVQQEQPPVAGYTQEQWSYLTPEEKAEILRPIQDLQRQVEGLKTQNQIIARDKIDTNMKAKWGDYDPTKVDSFFQQVNERRINDDQLIEMSWKAINFDRYVERAHKLGLEGRQIEIQEKQNGSTYSVSGNSSMQEEPPKRTENETSQSFFKRLADWRKAQPK